MIITNRVIFMSNFYKHLNGRPLQSYYTIEVEERAGSKFVTFHSKIHVNKAKAPSFSWSNEFTDAYILLDADLLSWVLRNYGGVWQ